MQFLLQINAEERTALIELNKAKLFSIRDKINELQKEAAVLHARIFELELSGADKAIMEGYSEQWSVAKKTEYCLSHHGAVLNTRQIAEKIDGFEGNKYSEDADLASGYLRVIRYKYPQEGTCYVDMRE